MSALLPGDGLHLNPEAGHPPFAWTIDLPTDATWSVLDTHPATWKRAADRLVDDRLTGVRVKAAQRREIAHFVADLVAQCQQSGTLLSMIQIGVLSSGEAATGGLHVAWYDSSPDLADLSTVRRAISRQGVVEEHDTAAGQVLLQRDHVSLDPFGNGRVGLSSLQAYLPVPGRSWTLVAATATPHPSLVEIQHDLVLAVVSSFRILDDGAEPAAPTIEEFRAPDSPSYEPVDAPRAPGIERGFGTLRPHRVEGDVARPQHRAPTDEETR